VAAVLKNADKVRYDISPQNLLQAKVSQVILNTFSSFDRKQTLKYSCDSGPVITTGISSNRGYKLSY